MHIDIITLFPEACHSFLQSSIVGRAQRRGLIKIDVHDPRHWAGGRHRIVDDRPYGGGPGMVLKAAPIAACLDSILDQEQAPTLLMTSPQGRRFDQQWAEALASDQHLVIICGHYEGIDERIAEIYKPQEFSIGDVVLSGGELAAMILTDAVTRLIPGVLGHPESANEDSFSGADAKLDHPCYTKPPEFRGLKVPDVLMSGDHAAIDAWRQQQRLLRTQERRPDLLE